MPYSPFLCPNCALCLSSTDTAMRYRSIETRAGICGCSLSPMGLSSELCGMFRAGCLSSSLDIIHFRWAANRICCTSISVNFSHLPYPRPARGQLVSWAYIDVQHRQRPQRKMPALHRKRLATDRDARALSHSARAAWQTEQPRHVADEQLSLAMSVALMTCFEFHDTVHRDTGKSSRR